MYSLTVMMSFPNTITFSKIATENKDTAASELKVKQNVVSKHTKGADRK